MDPSSVIIGMHEGHTSSPRHPSATLSMPNFVTFCFPNWSFFLSHFSNFFQYFFPLYSLCFYFFQERKISKLLLSNYLLLPRTSLMGWRPVELLPLFHQCASSIVFMWGLHVTYVATHGTHTHVSYYILRVFYMDFYNFIFSWSLMHISSMKKLRGCIRQSFGLCFVSTEKGKRVDVGQTNISKEPICRHFLKISKY